MSSDSYEKQYMAGKGDVLYRHKVRGPRWMVAMLGAMPLVFGAIGGGVLFSVGQSLAALSYVIELRPFSWCARNPRRCAKHWRAQKHRRGCALMA